MEIKNKYVLSIGTYIHALYENRDWEEPISSKNEIIEFLEADLLEARRKALEKAKYFENFFAEQPDPIYPTRKWNTIEKNDKGFFMLYQIQVFFKGENNNLLIYDDGDGMEDVFGEAKSAIFEDLLKEYEIFKNLGIETNQYEERVQYKDWEKVKNWEKDPDWEKIKKTEATILQNGIDWSDAQINLEANRISDESWKLINDSFNEIETNSIKKTALKNLRKKTNKKTEYKTTSIHRFKIGLEDIEISLKTSSTIPKEIQEELIKLIDFWKNLR